MLYLSFSDLSFIFAVENARQVKRPTLNHINLIIAQPNNLPHLLFTYIRVTYQLLS